ncbi:MAG: selenium-dependent molybdenum cofactor biosynthesis protein YqeB [Sphaerochaeta sp.]|jgi:xanthine dehydrogenase accessory factor|nr:selenium-dependent molybdenum cofactor biosynthesis protein YqeB [Sphaerochaeta sp.]
MKMSVIQQAARLSEAKQPFVYVVILRTTGSTSRNEGAMVVQAGGLITGTIGGGDVEAYAQRQALALLTTTLTGRHIRYVVQEGHGEVDLYLLHCHSESDRASFITLGRWEEQSLFCTLGLQLEPEVAILGLSAGGATVGAVHPTFLEHASAVLTAKLPALVSENNFTCYYSLPIKAHTLLLVGGGHVNQAIATLAHSVGLTVQVVETRGEFATGDLFAHARRRVVRPTLAQAFSEVHTDSYTYAVIASHAFDEEAAKTLLGRGVAYLGVLGSRHKAKQLYATLSLDAKMLARLHCPIGLDIGAQTPQEIAVSVIAEILAHINERSGCNMKNLAQHLVIVRGGGDLASGVVARLHRSGWRVIVLEVEHPSVIRRTASVAEAIYSGETTVEGIRARRIQSTKEAFALLEQHIVPVLVDGEGASIKEIAPVCVVDAIMAKRNLSTRIDDAPLVVALGPGFTAGVDCDYVIETMRGHNLGRIIKSGSAQANTGTPGLVGGHDRNRVLHSPKAGIFQSERTIGELVNAGDIIATVDGEPIIAKISGKLRGLLKSGLPTTEHFKVADIDPRGVDADHTTISDKAWAIGGAVLEVVEGFGRNMMR